MTPRTRFTQTGDILNTIADFRQDRIGLATFLDRVWSQIHDLDPRLDDALGELEDLWTEIEIVYALASAEGQRFLDEAQTADVEATIDRLHVSLASLDDPGPGAEPPVIN